MVTVKEAITAAASAVTETFGVANVRLEEVAQSDDSNTWCVTLSFLREVEPDEVQTPGLLGTLYAIQAKSMLTEGKKLRREYRTVTVDAVNGSVKAIKIREFRQHGSLAS